ncbi:TetR/AcrR family transcriptional regulator [Paucilactobacillus sp. N302-9]
MTQKEVKISEKKEKILTVARELFATKGFEATTTREINNQVGIADGLLYYYFPDGKREILETIIQQGIQRRGKMVKFSFDQITTIQDLEAQLVEQFNVVSEAFSRIENYQSFIITIRERELLSDQSASWLLDVIKGATTDIITAIQQLKNELRISESQIKELANVIVSIYQKAIYDQLLIKDKQSFSQPVRKQVTAQIHLLMTLIQTN